MSDRLKQVAQHFPTKYIRERKSAVVEEWLLSNPKSMNALSSDLVDQLIKNLQLFKTEGEPRVLLIQGKPPAFCAGGDIVSMFKAHKAGASPD